MNTNENSELVAELDRKIEEFHLLKHPFYNAWTAGTLSRETLALYAVQYYKQVEAFPGYLRNLASHSDAELRGIVEDNLAEELHPSAPHPLLWRQFAAALKVDDAALDEAQALPGIAALVDTYDDLSAHASAAEAVAALYAYEAQVPEIATQKREGLARFYGIAAARDVAYFAVHEEADQRHRAAWREWLAAQTNIDGERVIAAAERGLRALWGALDAVYPEGCARN
jgi:pyrroloquinoline-quinone synthase